jgi:hypothetical protein
VVEDHVDGHGFFAEPYHAVPRYCSLRGMLEGLNLKHDSDIRGDTKTFTTWKRE